VVLSDETDKEIRESGIGLCVSEPCFPIQIAHGHLKNLIGKKVDHLFVQNVLNMETADSEVQSQLCPWGQTLAFVLRSVPAIEPHAGQFMIPTVHFRQGRAFVLRELAEFAGRYGISRKVSDGAAGRAFAVQEQFMEELRRAGAQMLSRVEAARENAVILIGRPYNIYDKGANIDLPSKLRKIYGVNVIPIDFLSVDGEDIGDLNPNMYWSYGAKIIRTARFTSRHPHLHVIYITNFKCGPDSFIKHFAAEAAGKPFLTLQFDAHSNDAGMMTRVEAYLDSKGILRWWKKDQKIA
jgi:predicted nucleotide-binding protein (sugar kinase/HSP70/actin superfamily)